MTLLRDQVAIVTGAGRGLGRAVAETIAGLGASVVLASRNAPELDAVALAIKRAGGRALAQTADVADERQVQELVLAATRWVGPATLLVNSAGVVEPITPLARSDPALWLRNISINVAGTYLPLRAAVPGMIERGFGRVVNISSGAARTPSAGLTAYGAAKAAVEQLTRGLALELEGTGVTVCAYDPGHLDTAMQERIRRARSEDYPRADDHRAMEREGRLIDPRAAARAIAYLLLPATQRNGQALVHGDAELARAVEDALPG
jgi:NAD(P)-dependent dehydrogenase (short-subunit alcohol dehydrogenase family)